MSDTLLSFEDEKGEIIYIQIKDEKEGFGRRGREEEKVSKATKAFNRALSPIKSIVNKTWQKIGEFAESPEEVTLKMGITFTSEANAVITKASADANFELTIKWTQDSIKKAKEAQQTT